MQRDLTSGGVPFVICYCEVGSESPIILPGSENAGIARNRLIFLFILIVLTLIILIIAFVLIGLLFRMILLPQGGSVDFGLSFFQLNCGALSLKFSTRIGWQYAIWLDLNIPVLYLDQWHNGDLQESIPMSILAPSEVNEEQNSMGGANAPLNSQAERSIESTSRYKDIQMNSNPRANGEHTLLLVHGIGSSGKGDFEDFYKNYLIIIVKWD
ncbi:MAG: hypothetical protein ACTSQ8_11520 [Candidatus Helarchaeota archaeon]